MTVFDDDPQYSFDLSTDLTVEKEDGSKTDVQIVSLCRIIHNQERMQAVRRLRDSQIFDTSRFDGLINLR